MAEIRHRVGIAATPEQVYEAVSTREGLAGWWTREVKGNASVGKTLQFFFGGPTPAAVMEVTDATPNNHVGWRCVEGPDDWVGTDLHFDIKPAEGETIVLFRHADWREPSEFMSHCSTKWGYYMLGLKTTLEGGESVRYPGGVKASNWG